MMDIYQKMAQVEQENAITTRILLAEEVEIEEHYDLERKGNLGLKVDETILTLGLNAEGRKVSKRVIKFKGFNEHMTQDLLSGLMGVDTNSKSDEWNYNKARVLKRPVNYYRPLGMVLKLSECVSDLLVVCGEVDVTGCRQKA